MALERERAQPVDRPRVGDARRLAQLREHAGRREARHRVELVDSTSSPSTKKSTRAGRAAGQAEGLDGELLHARSRRRRSAPAPRAPCRRRVLGLVVVPVGALVDDLAGARRPPARASPITEHSTSRPSAAASTITRGSCASASSSASASPPRSRPCRCRPGASRAGLTKTGSPSAPHLGQHRLGPRASRVDAAGECGTPAAHQLLEDDLVHAHRRGEHARADVGHVEHSAAPGRSCPRRRARAGRGSRRRRRAGPRPARRLDSSPPRSSARRGRSSRRRPRARLGEPLAHGGGRAQRDLVLGRAPAGEDGDPHGGAPAWGRRLGVVSRPTTIVTLGPSRAAPTRRRGLLDTTPSCAGSSPRFRFEHASPASAISRTAPCSRAADVGYLDVGRRLATTSLTVPPRRRCRPGGGLARTSPGPGPRSPRARNLGCSPRRSSSSVGGRGASCRARRHGHLASGRVDNAA